MSETGWFIKVLLIKAEPNEDFSDHRAAWKGGKDAPPEKDKVFLRNKIYSVFAVEYDCIFCSTSMYCVEIAILY